MGVVEYSLPILERKGIRMKYSLVTVLKIPGEGDCASLQKGGDQILFLSPDKKKEQSTLFLVHMIHMFCPLFCFASLVHNIIIMDNYLNTDPLV